MKTKRIEKSTGEKIWILLSAAAAALEVFCAIDTVFKPEVNLRIVVEGMLIFFVCWVPYVFLKAKYSLAGWAAGIFPFVYFLVAEKQNIRKGLIEEIIGKSVLRVTGYFQQAQPDDRMALDPETAVYGILALGGMILAVCILVGSIRSLRGILLLLYGALFSFPFFTGTEMKAQGIAALGCAVLFLVMASPSSTKGPLLAVVCAALAAGILIPRQPVDQFFSDPAAWQEKIEGLLDRSAKGGVTDGRMGTADELVDTGELQLEITLSERPEHTVYLQGYIGTDYRNNRWEQSGKTGELSGDEIRKERSREYETVSGQKDRLDGQLVTAEISRKGASRKYMYLPYKNNYTKDLFGDTYTKGRGRNYQVEAVLIGELGEMEQNPGNVGEDRTKSAEAYTGFVNETYLQVPEAFADAWEKTAESLNGRTMRNTIRNVADYLDRRADYTKRPGRTPRGEDFVTYFLGESRQGYCVHFASAGVMLLRMNHIPARFVSGYIAQPSDFKETADGRYRAEIDDGSAHAWAEVYVEGCGWLPAEMTPAYRQAAPEQAETKTEIKTDSEETEGPTDTETLQEEPEVQTQEEPGQNPSEDPTDTETTPGESVQGPDQTEEKGNVAWKILWIGGVAATVAAVTGLLLLLGRKRKWRYALRSKNRRKRYLRMYHFLYQMVEDDLKKSLPEVEHLLSVLQETYQISGKVGRQVIDCVLETAFGKRCPGKKELRELKELCSFIRRKIWNKKGYFQKFLFTFVKGF